MVLGMSSESIDVIRQFVAEQGVTFPILHDKSGVVRAVYRLSGGLSPYPRDYIIDQDGIIRYTATEYHPQKMARVIESLLGVTSGVDNEKENDTVETSSSDYSLAQNYPNPFNSATTFAFNLPKEEHVGLSIYNLAGERAATLINRVLPAGQHSTRWNVAIGGLALSSGIYFYKLETATFSLTKKLSYVR